MFRRRALRRRLALAGAPPLPDEQLRRLARAVDAGAAGGECAPVAGGAELQVRLAAARAYRYPDLREPAELRRLPHCTDRLCCNPYHWSRLCKPETPPPPYSRIAMEEFKPKEQGESKGDARRTDHERLPTGSQFRQSWESEWCRLAYWELAQRVGRQFGVRGRAVDVFGGGGGAGGAARRGLCLDALAPDAPAGPTAPAAPTAPAHQEQVRKTRAKIGLGVTLALEADGVWLYNRSQAPVFASSPALDAAAAKALLVWRVAPGHCLRVFDPRRPPAPTPAPAPRAPLGPVDARSVRISFAKGWGPKYSRRDVTACPCWLEVLLAPPTPS
ncbi:hypothetical protein K1T71_006401 [Dendrolimus kikuchii]|uniref:Uncharacterized protein n=1 Tax=Dendrolimus kikuchii TaxID=765133 RepID=A0ACC1D0W4_9NEOP|nr:hypothetical protein K1T71_006401 [Dendrolimus kikuchii]